MVEFSLACSIGMEIIFALVTLLIAFYAFKIYKISYQKELELFGAGFLSICLSYIIWIVLNISAIVHLINSTGVYEAVEALNLFKSGAYAHMILFLVGLSMITFVTLKSGNKKNLLLLTALAIVPVFIAINQVAVFYSISVIFMLYLAIYYFTEYIHKKSKSLLTNFLAFASLAIGTLLLIFSLGNYIIYVVGHVFSFGAYALLLLNLLRSLKHGKKAK